VCGPGSSVGIATGYGLDGSGIESSSLQVAKEKCCLLSACGVVRAANGGGDLVCLCFVYIGAV
jgi:hypothetical protein